MKSFCHVVTLFLLIRSYANCCSTDSDCHATMVCSVDTCQCADGYVAWKWECYPRVAIGERCLATIQCRSQANPTAVCSPFSNICSCVPGQGLVDSGGKEKSPGNNKTIIAVYQQPKSFAKPKKITHPAANLTSLLLESAVLQSLFPTHPDPPPSSPNHSQYQSPGNLSNQIIQTAVQKTINSGSALPLVNEQDRFLIDMLMFLAMLMLGLVIAGVITAMYMRAVKEKRESQDVLKCLLEYLSAKEIFTSESLEAEQKDAQEGNKNDDETRNIEETIPPAILAPLPSLTSKLTLQPMDAEILIRFPSPHLSHARLPDIKTKSSGCEKRKETKYEELNPKNLVRKLMEDKEDNPPRYEDLNNL